MYIDESNHIIEYLTNFKVNRTITDYFGGSKNTIIEEITINNKKYYRYINEFWTSKQRQASSIHEISYRACFKPQLPSFFIKLLTTSEQVVYDPFSGRGTTVIEAGLLNRKFISNDINPLSKILAYPRFFIPKISDIKKRLDKIPIYKNLRAEIDLSMFYHPDTESEIVSLKNYLEERRSRNEEDLIDMWIRMVATNRLTGHSKGFFSVYTLPPNQAVLPERQIKINKKLNQKPEYRNTKQLILKKSYSLIRNITDGQKKLLEKAGKNGIFLENDARNTPEIDNDSVKLTVTSPPFLDVVQYHNDNWLRCWFNSIDIKEISKKITMERNLEKWCDFIKDVFKELYRITQENGWVAFEVGDIKKGKIKLDEYIVPIGVEAGFKCIGIIINYQKFTKTSNIWGIKNMNYGTNTNRIILFYKN